MQCCPSIIISISHCAFVSSALFHGVYLACFVMFVMYSVSFVCLSVLVYSLMYVFRIGVVDSLSRYLSCLSVSLVVCLCVLLCRARCRWWRVHCCQGCRFSFVVVVVASVATPML